MRVIAPIGSGFFHGCLVRLAAKHRDADLVEQISPTIESHLASC